MNLNIKSQRGSALILYVTLLISASALGASLAEAFLRSLRDHAWETATNEAFWAAEAGLAHARAALADDAGYSGGTVAVGAAQVAIVVRPGAQGAFEVEVLAEVAPQLSLPRAQSRRVATLSDRGPGKPPDVRHWEIP